MAKRKFWRKYKPKIVVTPETRELKRIAARKVADERRSRKRWYITLNIKPALHREGRPQYQKQAWPKLFDTESAAWAFANAMTGHPNKGIWTPPYPGARVVSYALETTYLPKPSAY